LPHSSAIASRPLRFELRQIRAFVCVADELHFGRAASRLCTSQPSLSRMIHNLEKAVGVALFARSTRKVRLTPAGEAFAAECQLALAHLQLAASAAQHAARGGEGRIHMAYMDFAIEGRVPQILEAYRTREPGVSVDLEYMPTAAQHDALIDGRIDLGFMTGEFKAPKIRNLLVEEHEFVVLLPDKHRLAAKASVRLSELASEPFVIGSADTFSSFRALVFDLCHTADFAPKVIQEVSNSNGIFGLVAAGAGITIYSGSARSIRRSGVTVKALSDVKRRIPIVAAWLADHPSQALHRFVDLMHLDAASPVPAGDVVKTRPPVAPRRRDGSVAENAAKP
jgi:DNA-binding transcriptional LysR family regulator